MLDWLKAVHRFVELETAHPDADLDDLSRRLQDDGLSEDQAERLIAFVPMAFGRMILEPRNPSFPDGYEIRDLTAGRSVRGQLSQEPAYLAAAEYASLRRTDPKVIAIGSGSAEVDVARQLSRENDSLAGVQFTEALMVRIPIAPANKP